MLLLEHESPAVAEGPDLGVIEEARRRRRRRHLRFALVSLGLAALLGGLAWSLSTGSSRSSSPREGSAAGARAARSSTPLDFRMRLAPTLTVGVAGWCEVPEEDGRVRGSACGGLPLPGDPILDGFGWGEESTHRGVEYVIANPVVAAVLIGGRRVPTERVPGLPYGLRAARIATSGFPHGPLVPLDANGRPLHSAPLTRHVSLATIRSWRSPASEPRGVCSLRSPRGISGLQVLGGEVSLALLPYPGPIVGHAFLPCAVGEYRLGGVPLKAFVLVDAADPTGPAVALPDFHRVERAPTVFADGGLLARRWGNAWIVVRQGRGPRQRLQLLQRLTARTPAR